MAKLGINTGSAPNVGDGDTLLVGAIKINSNFDELYDFLGNGTNLNVGIWDKNAIGINTTLSVGIGTTNATNTLTVVGDGSFTGVVTAVTFNGQINSNYGNVTNFTNTNSSIDNLIGTSATITTYFGTDLTVTNVTSTNSNTINLVSTAGTITKFNSTSGTINNLTGTAATISNLNGSSINFTGVSTLTTIANTNIISSGIITSTQFSVGATGAAININQNTISGPSEIIIDPSVVGNNTGSLRIKGDLYVDGSQFIVSTGDINLGDFFVGIATNAETDLLLDGAGIGIGSTNIRKTLLWNYSSNSLKFSENLNIPSNKVYKIGDIEVLSSEKLTISNINSSGVSTLPIANITNALINSGSITNFTGTSCTTTNLSSQQLNISGVSTLANIISTNNSTFFANQLSVSGVSTFNQPIYVNNDANFSDDVYFVDDKASNFGNSNSFKVYHASNSWPGGESSQVRDTSGSFPLILGGKKVKITDETGLTNYSIFDNVGVEIYQNLKVSGIVTASTFVGDGSGLTGVVGSGSGIIITDSGSLVGTAGTIDFGDGLSVSQISSGIVTVTTSLVSSQWISTDVGIHTLSSVGVGTTNPTSKLSVDGNVNVSGVVTASSFSGNASSATYAIYSQTSGVSTYSSISGISTYSEISGISTYSQISGISTYSTYSSTAGISTYAHTSGVSTSVIGGISSVTQLQVTGISTFVNGPLLIGAGTLTGTSSQLLQITGGAYVSENIGIATTNPRTPLQVENIYGIKTGIGTFDAVVGVAHTIDSFTISQTDFKTVEYTIHTGFGTYIQSQKVLVMQNGTTAYSQEYAIMYHPELIVSIGATITAGELRLHTIPESGTTGLTTYRFTRQSML